MLDPRIYRAALLPVLLVLIVVAFSLENRPGPARTSIVPDAFDGARAMRLLTGPDGLARRFPDRRPGSAGDAALATRIASELRRALPNVVVRTRRLRGDTIDGSRELLTVIAQQPGSGPRSQLLVVAARDAATSGAAAQLSGTAAMLELARVLSTQRPSRGVSFASISGDSGGQAGMRDLLRRIPRPVDAILELGDLAGPAGRDPLVVGWSAGAGAAPLRLQRTLALALRQETGIDSAVPFARTTLARFALPASPSAQALANRDGIPAVRLSASGEHAPKPDAPVSEKQLSGFGRAALRTLTALDHAPRIAPAPARDLQISRKLLPAWAVRLLAGALLLPALLTALDGVARLRRRGEPMLRWLAWVGALAAPFALAALFARALGLTGAIVTTAPPAAAAAAGASAWTATACTAAVAALGWLVVRPALARAAGAAHPQAAVAAPLAPALAIVLSAIVAWILNPYAALLLVAPANIWLLLAPREARLPRVAALGAVAVSLVPSLLAGVVVASAFGVPAVRVPWFAVQWVAGGQGGTAALLGWALTAGALAAAVVIALRPEPVDGPITVRGPAGYAGPGSLGGTESSLRR